MKWGKRRYKNKDGSLTPEGKTNVSNYKKNSYLRKQVEQEADKLIKSKEAK